jgi:hypothetical protein
MISTKLWHQASVEEASSQKKTFVLSAVSACAADDRHAMGDTRATLAKEIARIKLSGTGCNADGIYTNISRYGHVYDCNRRGRWPGVQGVNFKKSFSSRTWTMGDGIL